MKPTHIGNDNYGFTIADVGGKPMVIYTPAAPSERASIDLLLVVLVLKAGYEPFGSNLWRIGVDGRPITWTAALRATLTHLRDGAS